MPSVQTRAPDWLLRWEGLLAWLLCTAALAAIPLTLAHIGLSWDALNHHIYLGWTAATPRFGLDFLAAGYQSYQFPYLYWPVYALARAGASGVVAGVVLALLNSLAVPALWRLARICVPGEEWQHVGLRLCCVALGLCNGVVLSMFDTTGNDLLAAIPLVWAIALALEPLSMQGRGERSHTTRCVVLSGVLTGVAVAFKLSNIPVAVVLPLAWAWLAGSLSERAARVLTGALAAALACVLVYAPWGLQLWAHLGNPVYPFFHGSFEPLRQWLGWRP